MSRDGIFELVPVESQYTFNNLSQRCDTGSTAHTQDLDLQVTISVEPRGKTQKLTQCIPISVRRTTRLSRSRFVTVGDPIFPLGNLNSSVYTQRRIHLFESISSAEKRNFHPNCKPLQLREKQELVLPDRKVRKYLALFMTSTVKGLTDDMIMCGKGKKSTARPNGAQVLKIELELGIV